MAGVETHSCLSEVPSATDIYSLVATLPAVEGSCLFRCGCRLHTIAHLGTAPALTDLRVLRVGDTVTSTELQAFLTRVTNVTLHTDAESPASDKKQFSPSKVASHLLERGNAEALLPPTAVSSRILKCHLSLHKEATSSQQ